MTVKLSEIEKAAEGATPGPWGVRSECYCSIHDDAMESGGCTHDPWQHAIRVPGEAPVVSFEAALVHGRGRDDGAADAAFIAASRTAIPALTAALRDVLAISREDLARAVADAQNVPFVGPKQRRVADAALALIRRAITAHVDPT